MAKYRTGDGERLDQICHAHYGDVQMVHVVLKANPGLAEHGPVLPSGTVIELPDLQRAETTTRAVRLW